MRAYTSVIMFVLFIFNWYSVHYVATQGIVTLTGKVAATNFTLAIRVSKKWACTRSSELISTLLFPSCTGCCNPFLTCSSK